MRLDLLKDIYTLSETEEKTVQLVKNCLDQKFYVKGMTRDCVELRVYRQLMQCPHPGISMLYETTCRGKMYVLVEEFINGATLEYILSERSLGDVVIHHIMQQLLSTVEHLHSLQPPVIHRSIKSGNIMVLEHLEIRLINSETARVFKQDENRDTRVMGSVGYASPEQYRSHQSDCRNDIYAIGAVLKTMVQKGVTAKNIHSSFQHTIEVCTQLDPDKRYQSVDELQKALGYCKEKSLPRVSVFVLLPRLPGIRRDSAAERLLFLAYYGLCIILGTSMTVTPPPSPYSLICQRIAFGLCPAIIPAVTVDAGNVQELLPLQDHRRASIRFFKGSVLWSLCTLIIISLLVILAAILESLL